MPNAQTQVAICNQALGWLGSNLITSLDDEDSTEAKLCKANFAALRDAVLEDHEWSFAIKRKKLNPLADQDELYEPALAFPIPSDAIRILELSGDNRFRGSYQPEWYVEDNKILVEQLGVIYVRYIGRIEDVARWSPNFGQALAARLAYDLANPLTESPSIQESMFALYAQKLMAAHTTDGLQGRTRRARSRWMRESRSGFGAGGGSVG